MGTSDQDKPDDLAAERPIGVEEKTERPIGVEEKKVFENQERDAEQTKQTDQPTSETEEPKTTTSKEQVNEILTGSGEKQKPKKEESTRKLFDQFTKHFQVSKMASDKTTNMLKQIQKQLTQIDRTTAISNKQQVVVKQLTIQVRIMQKQLDRIGTSINRIKTVTNIKRKVGSSKRKKK